MIHKRGALVLEDSHYGSLCYFVSDKTERVYYLRRISSKEYDEEKVKQKKFL